MTEPISVSDAMNGNSIKYEGKAEKEEAIVEPKEQIVEPKEHVKPVFKYKSQEEAESAYKEVEKLIGKKAEEAKVERERNETLQKQLNGILVKAVTKTEKKEPEQPKKTAVRMKGLLDQVNALDPEDDDYHDKVAEIWGTREDEIESSVDTKVEAKVKEALEAYDKKLKESMEKEASKNTTISNAESEAKKAGFDMKKGSPDSELFWTFADRAPEGTIAEQIQWTVDEVKKIKAAYAISGSNEKAKVNQEQNSVLERHGIGKEPEEVGAVKPLGVSEALKSLQRRI